MTDETLPLLALRAGRAHEVYGPGAVFFAFARGAQIGGTMLWVTEDWKAEHVNPSGFSAFFDPSRFLLARAKDQLDVLAVAEEALRSGAAPLVVMDLSKPLGLTAGRRLQLAAKDGETTALAMISDDMGSNAVETRWHCTPVFDPSDSTLQRWTLKKNKSGTLGAWNVRWDHTAHRLDVVPPAGKRPGFETASD